MKYINKKKKAIMIRIKEARGCKFISVDPNEKVDLPKKIGDKYGLTSLEKEELEKNESDDKKVSIEDKKDKDGKYSKTDLLDATKKEQVQVLKDLGLSDDKITKLKKEKARVDKILKLQNAENN